MFRVLGNVLFGLVVLVLGGTILALTVLPRALNYQTYIVLSGSMEPTIPLGSVVVATAAEPDALAIGDIVTYVRPGDQQNVTHRIVGISTTAEGRTFTTKGDASGAADQNEIRYDRLAGKVRVTIPFIGYFFNFVGSQQMRFLFIVVPGLLLLGTWLWEIWRPEPPLKAPDSELPPGMAPAPSAPQGPATTDQHIAIGRVPDAAATVPLRR